MEEEVKRWLEKKKKELGQTSYEQEVPVVQPKIEPRPEPKIEPKIEPASQTEKPQPEQTDEVLSEIPEEPEEENTKHVEIQAKIASDMETMKMGEMPIKTGTTLTTRAKVLLALIVALVIFIVYWVFVFSPALLSGE